MATNEQSVRVYRQVQERMTSLLVGASPEQLARQVPACPDWSVRDLLAHVTGVAADVAAGRIEGAGSDPWTAAQVDARREHDRETLLAEWAEGRPALDEALLAIDPVLAAQVVFDVTTHEHDLRAALEQPGERDSDGVLIGWEWATNVLGQLRDAYGTGAIRLTTTDGSEAVCGAGDVTAAVTADRFEMWRAMTGRRSLEQVCGWAWEGEPAAEAVCLLPARPTPLHE